MTNPSVKLDRRLTLMLQEVPISRGFFPMLITRAVSFDQIVGEREQGRRHFEAERAGGVAVVSAVRDDH
jgi:hypothetical protein